MGKFGFTLIVALFLMIQICGAQGNISGTINAYTKVTAFNPCNNSVTTSGTTGFSVGQKVLIIQMKGASITTTNTVTYGSITNYNEAGNYEFATIASITGNVIAFQNTLVNTYNPAAYVQLVTVPQYTGNTTTVGVLTGAIWNAATGTGGVLVFEVAGNLNISAGSSIDMSAKGFRGGQINTNFGSCGVPNMFFLPLGF